MARLTWTAPARRDVRAIQLYIAQDNRGAAEAMVQRLYRAAEQLRAFPESGRVVPEYALPAVRELIVAPYRVLYRHEAGGERVQVLAVIHGSRQLPGLP